MGVLLGTIVLLGEEQNLPDDALPSSTWIRFQARTLREANEP
jgi:hypothetical protein